MSVHELAGKKAPRELLINVPRLVSAYYVRKPDPGIVELALSRAGCGRHEFALVGNSLETDIGAARAAGVVGIWVNRQGGGRPEGAPRPQFEVRELSALLSLFASSSAGPR